MKPLSLSLLPLLLLAISDTHAWGPLPHRTIALLSTRFLLPETAAFIRTILPKDETIAAAALWGDYFSHTAEGRWSGQLHYIDAHDDPEGGVCGVEYERDCGEGGMCVVGGIVNVTQQLQPPDLTPLPPPSPPVSPPRRPQRPPPRRRPHLLSPDLHPLSDDRPFDGQPPHWTTPAHLSLRFLLHFIADVHQPLHTEDLLRGGNSLHVKYAHRDANLHSVWDSLIPQTLRQGRTPRHAALWADALFGNITSLPPTTLAAWGGACFADIERVVAHGDGHDGAGAGKIPAWKARECAMEWARHTNGYICSYVFRGFGGPEGIQGRELGGEYAEGARGLVDELVGMAGWRLGGWLNLVVTGRLGLDLGAGGVEVVGAAEEEEGVKVNEGVREAGGWMERVGGFGQRVLGRVREVDWV